MKKLLKLIAVVLTVALVASVAVSLVACKDKETLIGYDIDLAKAVFKDLGLNVEFVKINWNTKETELQSKTIDLIWNGMTINDERLASMQISVPYLKNKQVAVIRKTDATKYTSEATIASAKLTAEKGSAGADIIGERFASSTSVLADDMVTAMTEVASGTSDVCIIDSIMAGFYTEQAGSNFADKLQIVPNLTFSEEDYGIAARKGDLGTIAKINETLKKLYDNGQMRDIAVKYGLQNEILPCVSDTAVAFDQLTDAQKEGWNYLVGKGKVIVGYTLFAPIAYTQQA